ncbi:hypothetical protein MMC19_004332, partial [Ptychographa xylographoides]|nr:hypothetical protein [Ptychographa xylographoides]
WCPVLVRRHHGLHLAPDVHVLLDGGERGLHLVPEPDDDRVALHVVLDLHRVHPVPQGAQGAGHRPQHADLQVALPALHRLGRLRLLRPHHRLQRLLRLQSHLQRRQLRHRLRRHPHLRRPLPRLEDLQAHQVAQPRRRRSPHRQGRPRCRRCPLARASSPEHARAHLVLDRV